VPEYIANEYADVAARMQEIAISEGRIQAETVNTTKINMELYYFTKSSRDFAWEFHDCKEIKESKYWYHTTDDQMRRDDFNHVVSMRDLHSWVMRYTFEAMEGVACERYAFGSTQRNIMRVFTRLRCVGLL
jgi:hypothetical protein